MAVNLYGKTNLPRLESTRYAIKRIIDGLWYTDTRGWSPKISDARLYATLQSVRSARTRMDLHHSEASIHEVNLAEGKQCHG